MAELTYIPVARIHPHPDNPRKELGDLSELADSIKATGILQNLTVVPSYQVAAVMDQIQRGEIAADDDDQYVAIIGHRRLSAAKLAGLTEVPCVVASMTAREQVETMLMENMQRADLTVYEQAQGFQMMIDLGDTVEDVSQKTGFSKTTVRQRLKMAELDPAKLKEVSVRQLSLGDFDRLTQIEDIKVRNSVLESIGTNNFNAAMQHALQEQNTKKNLPLVKKWLKEVGAKKLEKKDTWSNQYESYKNCSYYIYINRWGENDNIPPKTVKAQVYYYIDSNWLRLFQKREKAAPVRKSTEEREQEKNLKDAWAKLEEVSMMAFELRTQFIQSLTVTGKNKVNILRGALAAGLLEAVDYNSPDRTKLYHVLGIKSDVYGDERSMLLGKSFESLEDKQLPKVIHAFFGDSKDTVCVASTYRKEFPRYKLSVKLNMIYNWLVSMGYEMSTEEIEMLNGKHVMYKAGTPKRAGKKPSEGT